MGKPAWTAGDSMFCYMFYQVQRGATPKLSDNPKELEIIKYQKASSLGVFGCDAYKVFSDKKVDIGGMTTHPVLVGPDFTKYFRKDKPDRYLNTPLFMQKTMDDAEVMKKEDFTLTDTGTCPGMRPKADKRNASYVPSCTDAGVKKF